MNGLLPLRQTATPRHGTPACAARGWCGPFINQAFYAAFPDAMWQGMGDCVECGTTRVVATAGASN